MTFIHTFYSKPLFENKFDQFEISLNNILYDYALSLAYVHFFGHKIKLYTDDCGNELLSFLPYDEIKIVDNDIETKHFAASFKFYALKECEPSDILIDGDVILDKKGIFDFIDSSFCDILYSFEEKNDYIFRDIKPNKHYNTQQEYFLDLIEKINRVSGIKYPLPKLQDIKYPNTSLIRVLNKDLKDEWVDQYFYHIGLMKDIDFGATWPDIIIEQYFLGKIISTNNYISKPIIKDFPKGSEAENNLGFVHLGNEKVKYLSVVKKKLFLIDKNLYMKTSMKIFNVLVKHKNNLI